MQSVLSENRLLLAQIIFQGINSNRIKRDRFEGRVGTRVGVIGPRRPDDRPQIGHSIVQQ
jgi:hypothetical protein